MIIAFLKGLGTFLFYFLMVIILLDALIIVIVGATYAIVIGLKEVENEFKRREIIKQAETDKERM